MESLAANLREMQRRPLSDEHIAEMRKLGTERTYAEGDIVVEIGDPVTHFIFVEEGDIEILDSITRERYLEASLGPGQYLGDIAFLTGGRYTVPFRAAEDTRVTVIERQKMLDLMTRVPELSDIVITVFAARRRRQIEEQDTALRIIGAEADRAMRQIADFATRNRVPVQRLDLNSEGARALGAACGLDPGAPGVVFGGNQLIENPSRAGLAELMGLSLELDPTDTVDVLIVGGGPAGTAAAVYAGAEGLCALVLEDVAIGGQAGTSSRIENYMGFPTGISGADLVWRGEIQARKFGTRFAMPYRVTALSACEKGHFHATLDRGEVVSARSVLVATGVQYRRLPLDGIEELDGAGIYYAATESEARYCKDTEAVVIGGGNSAGQAAMYLSRTAKHVHVLVRSGSLAASMSSYLSSRLEADPRITIHYHTQVGALHGDDALTAVTLQTGGETPRTWELETSALFIMVGAAPNTGWLSGLAQLDDKGFILTGEAVGGASPYETSTPGIFAVGDVRAGSVKRVASAVGEGSVVISKIWEHVNRDG
ncbi:FAD-dependent oxidoreductase [Pseudaestuariivita sp.]|uniref:FAD-dependent oxidoreductase n=1 Tax=Pseudaestuariivita sp. TaxID=2211669 RepID=UPI0040595D9D